jgi:hypothetical protein
LTVNLKAVPELTSRTTELITTASSQIITTAADSVAASHVLTQLAQMRRWVTGIYHDAKAPLRAAKKSLDVQETALLGPLRVAEQQLMTAIVAFQAQETEARMKADAATLDVQLTSRTTVDLVRAPVRAPWTMPGMKHCTTYTAEVLDLRGLVLSVAAQLLLEAPGSTKVTRRWLTEVCQPTPQATLDLLQPVPAALNRIAKALNNDLAIPGVVVASTTTLVAP